MVTYMDLLRRLRNMRVADLNRPAIVRSKTGFVVVKSLCEAQDYGEAAEFQGFCECQLVIDVVHDKCEETIPA